MNNRFWAALATALVLTSASCRESERPSKTPDVANVASSNLSAAETASATIPNKPKILIVYFSRVGISESFAGIDAVSSASLPNGNTIVVANYIQEATGGDAFHLITDKVYPADYDATTKLAQQEQKKKERPSLKNEPKNLNEYDVVFLGYPNWWGTLPTAVFTFLENNDFAGKTIVPFRTHEGSGLGESRRDIKRCCPKSNVVDGFAICGSNASQSQAQVEKWVEKIGFHK